MKKRLSIISLILILALTLGALIGCTASNKSSELRGDGAAPNPEYNYSQGSNHGSPDNGIGTLPTGSIDNPNAKIIKNANANISTNNFDEFLKKLYEKINLFSGYTDSEAVGSLHHGNRYADISIRVPAESLDGFKDQLSDIGKLTYYSATKQDVTLTYATLKAELDTLSAEAVVIEELFVIAKASGDLTKISEIEKRLTEIRLRIAKIDAEIRVYDNQIAYSTLKLAVIETENEAVAEEEKNAFVRIGENLKTGFSNVWSFIVEVFIFLLSALPYVIITCALAGIAAVVAILCVKRIKKRRAQKSERSKDEDINKKD